MSSSNCPTSPIHLSIGGMHFTTTLDTLTSREPNSMLAAMFSGRYEVSRHSTNKGYIFIDRDGKHFRHILNWLRCGALPTMEYGEAMELLQEAEFFQLQGLMSEIHARHVAADLTRSDILGCIQAPGKVMLRLRGANLPRIDLSGLYLRDAIFTKANLQGAVFYGANLRGACLKGANLEGASLVGTKLMESDMCGTDLSYANLGRANLLGANMFNTNLIGAKLVQANLYQLDLSNAEMSGVTLDGANLNRANLTRLHLEGASLVSTDLCYSVMVGVNMAGANLKGPLLVGVDLKSFSNFRNANFEGANFTGNNIFFGPSMEGSNLSGAMLTRVTVTSTLAGSTLGGIASAFNINLTDVFLDTVTLRIQKRFRNA